MKNLKRLLFLGLIVPLILVFSLSAMSRRGKGRAAVNALPTGKVIIVAGPSSCGKTVITRSLTRRLNVLGLLGKVWVRVSLDEVSREFDEVVEVRGEAYAREIEDKCAGIGLDVPGVILSDRVIEMIHSGINVVVDIVFDEKESFLRAFLSRLFNEEDVARFSNCFLTVFLHCSFENLARRVAIRNAKGNEQDARAVGDVLQTYAGMVRPAPLRMVSRSVAAVERLSPVKFNHVVSLSPQLSPGIDDSQRDRAYKDQVLDSMRANMGLLKVVDQEEEVKLIPRAEYDCQVRSDKFPNDKIDTNIRFCVVDILEHLARKFDIDESDLSSEEEWSDSSDSDNSSSSSSEDEEREEDD